MKTPNTLRRLQIAHLLFGMMFWYGIEQLFLNKYLHTSSARGYLTIAFTASLLVFDIPCGVLADRSGRKNALLLGCVAQTIGLVVLGSSNSLAQYIIGSVLFGLFIALMNGAAQALLYDHLQLNRMAAKYGKQQGTVYAMFLLGAGIANLASGFIAHRFGLRTPYYASIVPSVLSFLVLWPIGEPPLSKMAAKWYAHLGDVWHEIRTHPRILLFGVQFVVSELILLTIGEFGQIYILTFHVSTIALGILWSLVALFAAVGRFYAHRMQRWPRLTVTLYCAVLIIFVAVHSWIGIVLYWLMYACNEALANIAETEVQDEAQSATRATLFSSVSFFGNLLAIPAIWAFNRLYVDHSIYTANRAAAITAACILIPTVLLSKRLPAARKV
jgi:MFS family permease